MDKEQPDYLSYLLRLWRVSGEEKAVWRASLESPHTGERRGFANLADLFTFLEKEAGHAAQGQTAPNADEKGGAPISDHSIGRQESKT
jgi:hypothetical protein